MTKGIEGPSRDKLHAFFREIVMAEPGIDRAVANRIADRCVQQIDLLLEWDRGRKPKAVAQSQVTPVAVTPAHVGPLRGASQIASPALEVRGVDNRVANLQPPPVPRFDPYAFSVVVTLVKKGRDALLARLSEIEDAEHLRQLANAQHLGVDPKLAAVEELRNAILQGAERRIAGRRAAAS